MTARALTFTVGLATPRFLTLVIGLAVFSMPGTLLAETINIHLTTEAGAPMAGVLVEFRAANNQNQVDAQFTDANGDCTLTDNLTVGTQRCIEVTKIGWTFYGTQGYGNPRCAVVHEASYNYTGRPGSVLGKAQFIGGSQGYVNPNRNEQATILFIAPMDGSVTMKIYTRRGQLLATREAAVTDGYHRAVHPLSWDAKGPDGSTVASGIYLARLTGGGLNHTLKIAVVKK